MKRSKIFKSFSQIVFTAVLFYLVTMPFRRLFNLTGLTEVRPASAFPPVFGLLFGAPGALGCAAGNLIADIQSGYSLQICIYGFAAQFFYGFLPYLIWHGGKLFKKKKSEQTGEGEICLNNVRHVMKYIGIVFFDSLFMAVSLGIILQLSGIGKLLSQFTLLLFFNNLAFSLILGIPIIILAGMAVKKTWRHVLTLNVRFVLIFLLLSVISAVLMGISVYHGQYPYAQSPVALWNSIYIQVSVDFFLLCGISICFLGYLEKNISIPIEKLSDIARNYAHKGKQDSKEMMAKCEELSRLYGETGYLAAAFKKMMEDVEYYIGDITRITAEKEKIRTELQVASRMQSDMLPDSHELLSGRGEFTLRAEMTPAREVGGDFYDFFLLDEDHIAFLVADVSGKGVPAALFMVVAKTLLQNRTRNAASPAQAFTDTNEDLCRDNKNGMFVTAWMGLLTISSGKLIFVNAGHTRPLLRAEGSYSYVEERSGFVLAGMEDITYQQEELYLKPGDALFLYTDGVTEATDAHNRLYGEERLLTVLNKQPNLAAEETLSAVREDIRVFQGEAEQFDDITMLAFHYNGAGFRTKTGKPDMAYIQEFGDFIDNILCEYAFSQKTIIKIRVAVDEIFSNICYYSGAKKVRLGCRIYDKNAVIYFEDDGIPFNPLKKENPDIEEAMEKRKEGGLGIYIVKSRMDKVEYEYREGKNRLTLTKRDVKKEG